MNSIFLPRTSDGEHSTKKRAISKPVLVVDRLAGHGVADSMPEWHPSDSDPIVRLPAVLKLTGCAESTWHRYVKDGHAPRGRRLGPNTVGWPLSEIQAWLKSRPLA